MYISSDKLIFYLSFLIHVLSSEYFTLHLHFYYCDRLIFIIKNWERHAVIFHLRRLFLFRYIRIKKGIERYIIFDY